MSDESAGEAWELYAVMKDGELVGVVARNPNRPSVIDITNKLARLLHRAPQEIEQRVPES